MLSNETGTSNKESTMYINIWSSPLLAGLSRGWGFWFDAMAHTQDLSAPWRARGHGGRGPHGSAPQRRDVGAYESACAAK